MKSRKSNKPSANKTPRAKSTAKPAARSAQVAATFHRKPMTVDNLIASPSELADTATGKCAIVMMTRIRLARNLADQRFPGWADETRRLAVLETCRTAIATTPQMRPAYDINLSTLNELEKQVLVERHLISRELSTAKPGAGVMINAGQTCSVMINEEDHLRIQCLHPGFHLTEAWNEIDALDTALETPLEYAFSSSLGYLTACPTNLGTGLRASAMMHLPALVITGDMERAVRAVNQLGITVRGQFGEGSDASGSIFQISNQTTLGETEPTIIRRLSNVLHTIIEQELNARARLIEKDPTKLFDKIGRAFGILKNSHLITTGEAMNLLSLARLGIDLGAIPETDRSVVDHLFMQAQPGHVRYFAKIADTDPSYRDQVRATLIRDTFAKLSGPNFDATTETPDDDKPDAPAQN